jgi:hypothetical protein
MAKKTRRKSAKTAAAGRKKAKAKKTAKAARPKAKTKKAARKKAARKRKPKAPPSIGDRLANAYQTVVDTVKGTGTLRNKLEPPGTSETE